MATWRTAGEIAAQYLVTEARLAAFAQRGNLPRFRLDDGLCLFDEDVVSRLFSARSATKPVAASTTSVAVLGETRLGTAERASAMGVRSVRKRSVRRTPAPPAAVLKRVAG
jgi:hypothetical protein